MVELFSNCYDSVRLYYIGSNSVVNYCSIEQRLEQFTKTTMAYITPRRSSQKFTYNNLKWYALVINKSCQC